MHIEFPGAIYHVMSRGDRREEIFHDEVDRQDFLRTLAEQNHWGQICPFDILAIRTFVKA